MKLIHLILLLIVIAVTFTRRHRSRRSKLVVSDCKDCALSSLCCKSNADKKLYCEARSVEPKKETAKCATGYTLFAIKSGKGVVTKARRRMH